MTANERKQLLSQGRNEFGHYGHHQIFCNKCHEPKTGEEMTGPYNGRRICFQCVVLEWNRQKLTIIDLRKQLRASRSK